MIRARSSKPEAWALRLACAFPAKAGIQGGLRRRLSVPLVARLIRGNHEISAERRRGGSRLFAGTAGKRLGEACATRDFHRSRFGRRPDAAAGGFTLVEVLVALAILALTFGFGFEAFSGAFDWLGRSRSSTEALALARSTLARVGHDIALTDGTVSGHGGNGMAWRVETAPYGDPRQVLHGPLAGHRVEVTVEWTEHRHKRELRLTTLRLGPAGQGS